MIHLAFENNAPKSALFLGAHADDIEIGCGVTILRLLESHPNLDVCWIVLSSNEQRAEEAKESANLFLKGASHKRVVVKSFRDGYFPYIGAEIKDFFEQIKVELSPEIIFTHYRDDLHQDHRLISELTWNTFRNHFILEYEIPKYDGDFGSPNFFVELDEDTCKKKTDIVLRCFRSQGQKKWFDEDTFTALIRLRGMESSASSRFAEAFYCRKLLH